MPASLPLTPRCCHCCTLLFPSDSRHKTSYIILRLLSKTYTMYRPQVQSPRLCRPQAFTARLRSTESQRHRPQLPQRKWPFSSFLLSPFQFFSESAGWEEQRSRTLLLSVCQHREKSHYLSFGDTRGYMFMCALYDWEGRGCKRLCVCRDKGLAVLSYIL